MMKKRILTALLAASMAVSMLAGCGKKEENNPSGETGTSKTVEESTKSSESQKTEEEPVTLRIFFLETAGGDEQMVSEYLSDLPQVKALNVKIEIVKEWNWSQDNLPLQLAGDEQMDIGWDAGANFLSRVDQQAYADLSEYLKKDPDFYNYIPAELWKGTTIGDGIYGIPTYKELGEQWGLMVDNEVLEKYNLDVSDIHSMAAAESLLKVMNENDLGSIYAGSWSEWLKLGLFDVYDMSPYYLGAINRKEAKKVESLFETQEFADYVKLLYSWNQKGYLAEELLTSPLDYLSAESEKGNFCVRDCWYAPCAEYAYLPSYTVTYMSTGAPVITNDATRGSVWGVYKKSKNPEKAYEFLKLWNTDAEVKNVFLFGIPDVHYTLDDNGQVEYITDADGNRKFYGISSMSGNVMLSYTVAGEPLDKYSKQYDIFNATAVAAADLGLEYDFTAVSDKVTNCTAVLEEYLLPLLLGYVEPESGIAQLNQKLADAGIHDVIDALDAQYQAFLAAK